MIRTHVLTCIAGCKTWVWKWLPLKQWLALMHVPKAAIVTTACITCATVPTVRYLGEPSGSAPVRIPRQVDATPVPEPGSVLMLLVGIAGFVTIRRR